MFASEDEEAFDFSALTEQTEPAATADPALAGLPENIQAEVRRFEQSTAALRDKLQQDILAARKVGGELLVSQSTKASPAARAELLTQAEQLSALAADEPIESMAGQAPAATLQLAGAWQSSSQKQERKLTAGGGYLNGSVPLGKWHWLDETRGIFYINSSVSPHPNLCQMANPKLINLTNSEGSKHTFTRGAPPPPATPKVAPNQVLSKLSAGELQQRQAATAALTALQKKTVDALLGAANALPAEQRQSLMQLVRRLEAPVDVKGAGAMPSPALAGSWMASGKTLVFAPDGLLLVNGGKTGRWAWTWGKSKARNSVVFTLGPKDAAAIGELAEGNPGVLRVSTIVGNLGNGVKKS